MQASAEWVATNEQNHNNPFMQAFSIEVVKFFSQAVNTNRSQIDKERKNKELEKIFSEFYKKAISSTSFEEFQICVRAFREKFFSLAPRIDLASKREVDLISIAYRWERDIKAIALPFCSVSPQETENYAFPFAFALSIISYADKDYYGMKKSKYNTRQQIAEQFIARVDENIKGNFVAKRVKLINEEAQLLSQTIESFKNLPANFPGCIQYTDQSAFPQYIAAFAVNFMSSVRDYNKNLEQWLTKHKPSFKIEIIQGIQKLPSSFSRVVNRFPLIEKWRKEVERYRNVEKVKMDLNGLLPKLSSLESLSGMGVNTKMDYLEKKFEDFRKTASDVSKSDEEKMRKELRDVAERSNYLEQGNQLVRTAIPTFGRNLIPITPGNSPLPTPCSSPNRSNSPPSSLSTSRNASSENFDGLTSLSILGSPISKTGSPCHLPPTPERQRDTITVTTRTFVRKRKLNFEGAQQETTEKNVNLNAFSANSAKLNTSTGSEPDLMGNVDRMEQGAQLPRSASCPEFNSSSMSGL